MPAAGWAVTLFSFHGAGWAWPVTLFLFTGREPTWAPPLFFFDQPEAGLDWIYSVLAGQPLPPALASRPEAVTLFFFRRPARLGGDLIFFQPASRAGPVTLFYFRRAGPIWAMTLFLFEISNKNPICAK